MPLCYNGGSRQEWPILPEPTVLFLSCRLSLTVTCMVPLAASLWVRAPVSC